MFSLADLDRIIADRAGATDGTSYTAAMIDRGTPFCARKLGEEAVEAIVAASTGNADELTAEAADMLYHLLVLLRSAGVPLSAVMEELERRTAMSGLQEKALRQSDR